MTEFITRNYGNENFEIIIKTDSKEHYKAAVDFARWLIDHAKPAPTIEAKPVVHAHWISKNILITPYTEDDYEEEIYSCSNCTLTIECETPYCPYCGALMDEIVETDNEIVKGSTKIVEGGKE